MEARNSVIGSSIRSLAPACPAPCAVIETTQPPSACPWSPRGKARAVRALAHVDFAGSVRVLQVNEVGKKSYCKWYSQDFEIGETEVSGIHTEDLG